MYLVVLDQEGNPLYPMDCTAIWKLDKTLPFDKQIEMSREYFEYMLEPVSYTHLDVYKRQTMCRQGIYRSGSV